MTALNASAHLFADDGSWSELILEELHTMQEQDLATMSQAKREILEEPEWFGKAIIGMEPALVGTVLWPIFTAHQNGNSADLDEALQRFARVVDQQAQAMAPDKAAADKQMDLSLQQRKQARVNFVASTTTHH